MLLFVLLFVCLIDQVVYAQIPDGAAILSTMAEMFETVGMYEAAIDAHVRSGNARAAVDCAVLQNRWDKALELSEQHDFPQVEGLLSRYSADLIAKKRNLEAVELYRRTNRPSEAAILLGKHL